MPHELFEEIAAPTARRNVRSPYTIGVSIVAHVIAIAAIVITPILAVDAVPAPATVIGVFVPPKALPPPPPAPRIAPPDSTTRTEVPAVSYEAPVGVHPERVETPPSIASNAVEGGSPFGLIESVGSAPAPPPPPPVVPRPPGPVRIGGDIREPQKVHNVAPVYPSLARQVRVQGTVVIQAVIGVDGSVREAQVQSSVPLLDQAALDAVRQWRYRPTLLNGVAVPVIMTVSVRFTLQS